MGSRLCLSAPGPTPAPLLPAECLEETPEQLRVRIHQAIQDGARELDFRGSTRQLGSQGAAIVAELLRCDQGCNSVNTVYLCGNSLGDDGAACVAAALQAGTPLTFLDLRSNGIGDAGAESLAKSLMGCSRLASLDLWFNPIRRGANHFVDAMAAGAGLTWLRLDEQPAEIDASLARNRERFVVLNMEDAGSSISFMSMGGNEVLVVNAPASEVNLKELAAPLASAVGVGVRRLRIALADGRLVSPADEAFKND